MDLYFDNAATTRLSDEALEAYIRTEKEFFGNPSSVHREGIKAKKELERIRASIASAMGIQPSSLFFTSGATDSIASVFSSLLFNEPGRIIISSIEHEAVASWLPILKHHGWDTVQLKAKGGTVDPDELASLLTPDTMAILWTLCYITIILVWIFYLLNVIVGIWRAAAAYERSLWLSGIARLLTIVLAVYAVVIVF